MPARTKGVRKVNPARREREWARAYGSTERVYYIGQHLACIVHGCEARECENAHTETGGMGRKADADTVVPLCTRHHAEYHRGAESFASRHGLDLEQAARETEAKWALYGDDVVARAKADGRYARWLARNEEGEA